MILSLDIKNFQSHKRTRIDLDSGVNAIVGSSDQGKSAVLRALLWAVNNRPNGTDDILSHWARDEKGKIIEGMAVGIRTDRGNVTRQRSEKENEYVLFDFSIGKEAKVFKAINRDVPEDIQDFFQLTDVNIQAQHDSPFLLSASAGDVARYFNRIVRLDVIDKILGGAESKRREQNKKIKTLEIEKTELEKELQTYDWIKTAQPLAAKLDKILKQIELDIHEKTEMEKTIKEFIAARKIIKSLPDVQTANKLMSELEAIEANRTIIDMEMETLACDIKEWHKKKQQTKTWEAICHGKKLTEAIEAQQIICFSFGEDIKKIKEQVVEYRSAKKKCKLPFDKEAAQNIIIEFEGIRPDYTKLRELDERINEWTLADTEVKKYMQEIKSLNRAMPKKCPTCGQALEGGVKND